MARLIRSARPPSRSISLPPPKLLEYLAILGSRLKEAEGRSNGIGLTHATVHAVHVKHLHELGSMLIQIANGADARAVFPRQKPKAAGVHRQAALAFYSAWVGCYPKAHDAHAIAAARLFLRKGTEGSIKKIAQEHRDWCLETLSKHDGYLWVGGAGQYVISGRARRMNPLVLADGDARFIRCWGPKKTGTLREYLRRKSARHVEE